MSCMMTLFVTEQKIKKTHINQHSSNIFGSSRFTQYSIQKLCDLQHQLNLVKNKNIYNVLLHTNGEI